MIKYKTYICSTERSFIFYFLSSYDIIMFKVGVFVFFDLVERACFLFNLRL